MSATPTAFLINYGSGFSSSSGLQFNGSTTLSGTRLRLTNGQSGESSSAFYTTPVNVQSFTTNFSFQMTDAQADGMTFVIQNGAATVLGTGGGGLGYEDIGNSVAVKFDIYNNAGEGTDSTGMYVNGAMPTVPAVDMTSSGVVLLSGDVMNVQLSYNGTTLTLSITDATTSAKFTTSWTVNIPTTVGSTTALVGFTGGTGGTTSIQDVLSWTYNTGSNTNPPPAPTNLVATAGNAQVGLSWSASSGATSYNVQRSTTSGGPYTTIAKSNDDELHRHGSDERNNVLLRSGGGKHGGAECELQPSKCDAARDTTGTDELGGNAGERAGGVELECVEWSDQLQRAAVDDERGTIHDDRQSDDDELHRHRSDERDDLLLRGRGGEHGGAECELQPGECNAHRERNRLRGHTDSGDWFARRPDIYLERVP